MDGMKKAYKVGLYGNNPKAIDGTWRELFDDEGEGPTEGKSFEDAMKVGSNDKVRRGPNGGNENDGYMEELAGGEAMETGGENKGGDLKIKGIKRTKRKAQGTLDVHLKIAKR